MPRGDGAGPTGSPVVQRGFPGRLRDLAGALNRQPQGQQSLWIPDGLEALFLDEVGEMVLDLQAKLLRVLQEGEYERGGSRTEKIDVRIVAATNRDLARQVKEGAFRQDLWYHLNVFPIHAPPPLARGADVLLLAEAFARRLARQHGRPVAPLTQAHPTRCHPTRNPNEERKRLNRVK
jgi:transcriptional regulator of aromatic amino acid metabolism